MQTMNISLPDPLKKFVDAQIAQGRYSSVSGYVREPACSMLYLGVTNDIH